ncbi:MAG: hypothetical protein GY754_24280 [bacterium]|nr:hypothetical protein [bacterium]
MLKTKRHKLLACIFIQLIIIIVLPFTGEIQANEKKKPRIAVLDFKADNTSRSVAESVRDILEVHLYKTGAFDLLERAEVDPVFKERGITARFCSDAHCAAKMGEILAADKIIIGSVNKTKKFTITLKCIDLKKNSIEFADYKTGLSENEIINTVKKFAQRAAANIEKPENKSNHREPALYSTTGYYFRGIVPGWAQIYAGKNGKGYLFIGMFTVSSVLAGFSIYDFNKKRDEYDSLTGGSSSLFQEKYETSDRALTRMYIAVSIWAAVYIANWIDAIFFSKPSFGKTESAGTGKAGLFNRDSNYFSFSIYNPPMAARELQLRAFLGIEF